MISALTGQLVKVSDDGAEMACGPIVVSLLVPAIDVEPLSIQVGDAMTFHTMFYLEGSASGGNMTPRLIGFARVEDREFFELFTTVKGIGPKTALRALTEPIGSIAAWIESKDARMLTKLPGIGKRTAELVVAELAGKCTKFAMFSEHDERAAGTSVPLKAAGKSFTPTQEDAIRALVNLGERRLDAEQLLDRAVRDRPGVTSANELVAEMLRLRAG